ncbi:916_t:CDS:2, partial [Gigaspora margarita]
MLEQTTIANNNRSQADGIESTFIILLEIGTFRSVKVGIQRNRNVKCDLNIQKYKRKRQRIFYKRVENTNFSVVVMEGDECFSSRQ